LIVHQPMKIPTVVKFRNHWNTTPVPFSIAMNAKKGKHEETAMATYGIPPLEHLAKNIGASPRRPIPYKIRLAAKRIPFAAENTAIKIPALMIEGSTLMPDAVIAITKGL